MTPRSEIRAEIWIGDLVRALATLGPLETAAEAELRRVLGLTRQISAPEVGTLENPAVDTQGPPLSPSEPVTESQLPDLDDGEPTTAADQPEAPETPALSVEVRLLPRDEQGPSVLVPRKSVADLLPPPPEQPMSLSGSLFQPSWQRAILSTALATISREGPVDVATLTKALVSGRPVGRIPRLRWPTLRLGVQLLMDFGESMLPFLADQHHMARVVRDVVGKHAVQVLRFDTCPSRGAGPRARSSWTPYTPPSGGRPVLALSDLGIGRPATERGRVIKEWESFADTVRSAGTTVVVFVPQPASRWPETLMSRMHLVCWDRTTSVRNVRRGLSKATQTL